MFKTILSICIILITVPVVYSQEPVFKIFDKNSQPPAIFTKLPKSQPIKEYKQLNEIEYEDLIKIVKQGKVVRVAVGDTSLKADYFVKSIPNTEVGIWKCFLDNGQPKMERIPNATLYQRTYIERVVPFSGST